MPFESFSNNQRMKTARAVQRVHEIAGSHVEPAELARLTAHAKTDAGRLALGIEVLILISTGIGFVSTGLGIFVKNLGIDARLAITSACLIGGTLACWWGDRHIYGLPPEEPTHLDKTALLVGVVLLGGFSGAVQNFYQWPTITNLGFCVLFLFLAGRSNHRAVLVAALTALAAFFGVQEVPNSWKLITIATYPARSWLFFGSVLLLATILKYWKNRPGFAVVCIDIAIPVVLLAECNALFDAVDKDLVNLSMQKGGLVIVVASLVIAASRFIRIRFLSVTAISATVISVLSLIRLWLNLSKISSNNQDILFLMLIAAFTLLGTFAAIKLVRTAPKAKASDESKTDSN